VLITGGASGLGLAMAAEYARRGSAWVTLVDVDSDALSAAAAAVRAAGARNVHTAVADVCDAGAMAAVVAAADARAPLDCVHANAGLAESSPGLHAYLDLARAAPRLTAVNVNGVVATVLPALAAMRGRGRGRVVITASLAGFTSYLTSVPSYAASKNWARAWALGLRAHFWSTGVRVACLCPGFIDTAMTRSVPTHANGVPTLRVYPGLLGAEEAARRFLDGLAADKAVVTFPASLYLVAAALSRAPLPIADFLLRNTPTALGALWGPTRPELVSPTPDATFLAAKPAAGAGSRAGAGAAPSRGRSASPSAKRSPSPSRSGGGGGGSGKRSGSKPRI
jgi:NADP-dependent 3-hydroxy acid dehydrogenase YdfG